MEEKIVAINVDGKRIETVTILGEVIPVSELDAAEVSCVEGLVFVDGLVEKLNREIEALQIARAVYVERLESTRRVASE